jgi:hypothetical protein
MLKRTIAAASLLVACNSQPAPTPAQEPTPPATAAPKAEVGKQFGSAFKVAAAEPLTAAVARLGKASSPVEAASGSGEHACGDHGAKVDGLASKQEPGASGKGTEKSDGKTVESCGELTKDATGQMVRVSGTVSAVCQKAGCWMTLQDGSAEARIFTREHKFFMPKDIVGKRAEVEGNLRVNAVSAGFAKHLAEDGGKDPASVNGPQQEYVVNATGVRILD